MKSDLPRLMRERNLDALVVLGPDNLGPANAPFAYFIGGAHVSTGYVIVKQSGESFVVCSPMERDEAAKTGMTLVNKSVYKLPEVLKQKNGNRIAAEVEVLKRIMSDVGVSGRVGFYGAEQANLSFNFLNTLIREEVCEVVTEGENDILSAARTTKDEREAEFIHETCNATEVVIGATRDFLKTHRVADETLLKADGSPLTIADVKRFIRRECAANALEMHDCIFSIGRDAGIGHSSGNPSDVIQLGKTMVFDIFPRGANGYHSDITRTWCLGYAPDYVIEAHALVCQAHNLAEGMFNTASFSYEYQDAVCDLFEQHGHKTLRQDYTTTSGYYHGLGHGFGLQVHEPPSMANKGMRADEIFQPGTIICNEPGLYYPDDPRGGWGVRVEDDYWFDLNGKLKRLTEFDRSLIVPI
jgi:Xaa-Pro aminopeptidase